MIDCAILQANGLAANTIVAGGKQGCDPHERGHGPLCGDERSSLRLPRARKNSATFVITPPALSCVEHASEGVRKLYDTVLQGQKIGFGKIRAKVKTADVHQAVQHFFVQQGYKTGRRNEKMQRCFHGTGHWDLAWKSTKHPG